MRKPIKVQLQEIVKQLEDREKKGANPEAMKVLYDILEVMNEMDIEIKSIRKEIGYSESFITDADVPHRLRS